MEKHSIPTPEKIIQFNESAIQGHLSEMVRHSVEATLNQMLDAEADRLCHADKYQRSEARKDTRAGHYQRKLHTKAGEVTLNMPKLRRQTFETAMGTGGRAQGDVVPSLTSCGLEQPPNRFDIFHQFLISARPLDRAADR